MKEDSAGESWREENIDKVTTVDAINIASWAYKDSHASSFLRRYTEPGSTPLPPCTKLTCNIYSEFQRLPYMATQLCLGGEGGQCILHASPCHNMHSSIYLQFLLHPPNKTDDFASKCVTEKRFIKERCEESPAVGIICIQEMKGMDYFGTQWTNEWVPAWTSWLAALVPELHMWSPWVAPLGSGSALAVASVASRSSRTRLLQAYGLLVNGWKRTAS